MCTHYPRGPESAVMDARVLETSTRGLNPLDDVVKVADCVFNVTSGRLPGFNVLEF